MGADFIEPDLVSTKDGVARSRATRTRSAARPTWPRSFPTRKTHQDDRRAVDHRLVHRGLHARRDQDAAGAGAAAVPLARAATGSIRSRPSTRCWSWPTRKSRETGRAIGVYPETKHPTYFRSIGLPLEPPLLETLARHGEARARRRRCSSSRSSPPTCSCCGRRRRCGWCCCSRPRPTCRRRGSPKSRTYADGIGPNTRLIVPANPDGTLRPPTTLVADAHAAGLLVHVWTLRSEPAFLSPSYGGDPEQGVPPVRRARRGRHLRRLSRRRGRGAAPSAPLTAETAGLGFGPRSCVHLKTCRLRNARLCLDCDEVHDESAMPDLRVRVVRLHQAVGAGFGATITSALA